MNQSVQRSLVERALLMRDVIDGQLESSDRLRIGRVADVLITNGGARGGPRLISIVVGPEALAGRVRRAFGPALHRLLHGRWERTLPIEELQELGPTLRLRRPAHDYDVASGERWVGERIVRRLPGAGTWPPAHSPSADEDAGRVAPSDLPQAELRGADLVGAHVVGPAGERLGEVLDVELRPKDGFAIDSLIVAKEPALARLVLLRQVGPRPDGEHVLVPWSLVSRIDDRTILLAKMPTAGAAARRARADEREGEAAGASPASAVGERSRTEAPGRESAAGPARRTRRARQ